jgi:outer membrane protein insertion porin family
MKVPGLILGLLLPWFAQAQQQYYGTRVSNISLSGSQSDADLQVVPIRVGDTITPENIRASIQRLYDTGRYSQVDVEANRAQDGTTSLVFRVRPIFFFSTFRLEPENLLERPLSSYFRLPIGEKFATSAVDRVREDARKLLESEGYFQAVVSALYESDEVNHLVSVTLKATPGPRARVGMVRIQGGELTFTPKELADAFGLKSGDEYSGAKLDKGKADIRTKFAELQFLNTKVNAEPMYVAATNTVDINVTVQPGQFALVQPRGFDINKKKLRELVPIFEEAAVDPDLVEEGRVTIERYMQQQGYFDAMVTSETIEVDPSLGNAIQINYTITPGAKHQIVDIRISGNYYFETTEIRQRMKSRRAELLSHGVFSADLLEEDRRTIEAMYTNAGFEGTVVTATPQDVDHNITVLIEINEGKRVPIDSIGFAGNAEISSEELRDALSVRAGDIYTPRAVDQARAAITQLYYRMGFADARVELTTDRDGPNGGVRLNFQITEGESYLIGTILVAGNTLTQEKVIRRSSGLHEYTPFDPEAVLEAQQRLYALGLFSRVEVVALNQGLPGTRNILIQVEDAKPILLTYGIGYQEFEHLRGTFEISHNNLFGFNRSISFRLRGSSRERLAQATFHEPRLFNHELDGFASSFVEHTERPFFSANRIDFSLQVLKRFSTQSNLLMTSSWQTVNIGDVRINTHAQDDPAQQGPCHICQIGRIGTSYIHDRRNDPVYPTTGAFNTVTFQVAARPFGSELNFTSLFNQFAFYLPAGSGVLATSFRFGWNHPFGKTAQFADVFDPTTGTIIPQTQQLPATERYWAGGSTTLRGFGLDEARPRSDLNLEGGNVLTIGNVEYRFPLRRAPISGLGAAVFYDTGSVFSNLASVAIRDFTQSAGFGLRYQTPVGPVRLDFGTNLFRKTLPDKTLEPRFKFFFTLGNTF